MPVVHVPSALRNLTDGLDRVEVEGATLRDVFAAVEEVQPTLVERIMTDGMLRPDIAVAIDGTILDGGGLIQPVQPDAEIYLVPPIGGGSGADAPSDDALIGGGRA